MIKKLKNKFKHSGTLTQGDKEINIYYHASVPVVSKKHLKKTQFLCGKK